MGWDIHVSCQYTDHQGNLQCGDHYSIVHRIGEQPEYQVIEPIAEFRNYNLFRPLADVHNRVQNLEQENAWWNDFYQRSSHQTYGYYSRGHVRDQFKPETSTPTDVVAAVRINENEVVHPVVKAWVIDHSCNDEMYKVSLQTLLDFADQHPTYKMFGEFVRKAHDRYIQCNAYHHQVLAHDGMKPYDLDRNTFMIVYGFDY